MAIQFNFNNTQKKFITVTLPDENETVLFITTPTKKMLDKLINMEKLLNEDDENKNEEIMNEIYEVCSEIMSKNKAKKKITKETVEELLDFEDIIQFLEAYMSFVSTIVEQKN